MTDGSDPRLHPRPLYAFQHRAAARLFGAELDAAAAASHKVYRCREPLELSPDHFTESWCSNESAKAIPTTNCRPSGSLSCPAFHHTPSFMLWRGLGTGFERKKRAAPISGKPCECWLKFPDWPERCVRKRRPGTAVMSCSRLKSAPRSFPTPRLCPFLCDPGSTLP